MRKAIIYVFSGTGNTAKACSIYRDEFVKNGIETTVYNVKKGFENLPDPNDFDLVGFGYPVHGFNAPEIFLQLAKNLPVANNAGKTSKKEYFVVKTSGEPLKINNVSSIKFNSIMRRKGYVAGSEYHYVMPYNMIFRHTDKRAYDMNETLKALAPIEAREVLAGKVHKLEKVPFGAFVAWVVRIEHPAMKVNGRLFKVDEDKCARCGLCVKNCPENNISVDENGKFRFGGDCVMCARCSFNCPKDAFDIGILNGWRVNGKYSFAKPIAQEKDKHARYCKKAYERYFKKAQEKIAADMEK